MAVTTVARAYQSPDGAFSLEVPAGWTARKEEGSNEISFLLGHVTVSAGAVPISPGQTVDHWVETSKLLLKEQCPTAEVQTEGKTTVAGAPGVTFTMFCPGPRLPTTVQESAALLNGKIFTFNITAPSLEISSAQSDIDSMAKSFRFGVEKHPEHADADYDQRMKALKEDCAAGKVSQSDCATKSAEIGADHARAMGSSDEHTGQVMMAVAQSYQDPAHRFSLDIPSGFTLAQRGEHGQDGVVLTHDKTWITVAPRQGERPEETLTSYSRQVQEAYTDLHEGKHGVMNLNGHRALTDSFTGVDKSGAICFVGMTDIDMGRGNSVAIIWSAPQEESALAGVAVQKLQQGIW